MARKPLSNAEAEEMIIKECKLRGYSQRTIESYVYHVKKFISSGKEPREYLLSLINSKNSDETVRLAGFAIKFILALPKATAKQNFFQICQM